MHCPNNQKSTNDVALFLEKTNSVEKRKRPYTVGKLIQPLRRTVRRRLNKLNIDLPCDPAIPLLGIYPEKTITQQ